MEDRVVKTGLEALLDKPLISKVTSKAPKKERLELIDSASSLPSVLLEVFLIII